MTLQEKIEKEARLLDKAFGYTDASWEYVNGEIDDIPMLSSFYRGLYFGDYNEFTVIAADGKFYIAHDSGDYYIPTIMRVKGRNKKIRARIAAQKINEAIGITEEQVKKLVSSKRFI